MNGIRRRLAVTGILALSGFLSAAMLGAVVVATNLFVVAGVPLRWDAGLSIVAAAVICGVFGAVLGPAGGWLLMRHVPIGRAVAQTALGTLIGAALGFVLRGYLPLSVPWPPLTLAITGFIVAAVRLRLTYKAPESSAEPVIAPGATDRALSPPAHLGTAHPKAKVPVDRGVGLERD